VSLKALGPVVNRSSIPRQVSGDSRDPLPKSASVASAGGAIFFVLRAVLRLEKDVFLQTSTTVRAVGYVPGFARQRQSCW